MAKKKIVIGSIIKAREEGRLDYIKVNGDHTLKSGQYLNLESKQSQIEGLDKAVAEGKLSAEVADKRKAAIANIPDWVRFQITTLIDE